MKPTEKVISLKNVTKLYGDVVGIQDVSLDVPAGTVFGFLGPNGAGKTTTISMLVDLIRPTSGSINVLGLDSVRDSLKIRREIGFLAGDMRLDNSLTGWQQLEYFGHLHGGFNKQLVAELSRRLDCNLNKKFKTLSRGNQQKVSLVAALMNQPRLLILDEPTSGLDPLIQQEFNKIILEQKQRGTTTFISSHLLSEVQEICDHVAFIKQGKLIASNPMSQVVVATTKTVTITGASKEFITRLKNLESVSRLKTGKLSTKFNYSGDVNELLSLLSKESLHDISIQQIELEDVFMHYYGAKNA
jgi:ABC-2 type transport system ATP-binding protein